MNDKRSTNGSLQISTDVIAKIATMATVEIEGAKDIKADIQGVRGLFKNIVSKKAVEVILLDGVAQITINLVAEYGFKIQPLCTKIQENVKAAVQNMTGITVSRVNVVVVGVYKNTGEDLTDNN